MICVYYMVLWIDFQFIQTAEALHVKGFADVADKESFSAALLTQQNQPSMEKLSETRAPHIAYSQSQSQEVDDGASAAKRKRHRHGSGQSKSGSQEKFSPDSPQARRQNYSSSREATGSLRFLSTTYILFIFGILVCDLLLFYLS